MDDQVKSRPKPRALRVGARIFRGVTWTLMLLGVLFAIDRGFFGPVERPGWLQAKSLREIPADAGPLVFPAFLPQELSWPPARIYHREAPDPGWWLGLTSRAAPETVMLWMGSGMQPLPDEFGDLGNCLADRARCPEGWHVFSSEIGNNPVFLITRVDPALAAQILTELKLDR